MEVVRKEITVRVSPEDAWAFLWDVERVAHIRILEVDHLRRFKAVASGRDASVGSSLKVTLDLCLSPTADGSRLVIVSSAD